MKILVINSAKGGVGKTEITKGIARELSSQNIKVAILDLDVTTPNIVAMDGVEVHSAASGAEKSKTQIKKLISGVVKNTDAEYLIVDTPPTISSTYMAISETLKNPQFIFVTTPSENAIKDTSVGINFFAGRGITPVGVIQNMTQSVFGSRFDSEERMGIPTVGEIPLCEDTTPYFKDIVDFIEKMDFEPGGVKENFIQKNIFSKMTMEEAKRDTELPLRFYNLETWDYFREKILEKELSLPGIGMSSYSSQSRYNIPTSKLRDIINAGETVDVMIQGSLSVENAPLPYEIVEAQVYYDHKFAHGLPMLVLPSGVNLWIDEVILVDDKTIKETLEMGGKDMGGGRIIQPVSAMMYYMRAFDRKNSYASEIETIKKYIDTTKIDISPKEIAYTLYRLEDEGEIEFEDFSPETYVEESRKDYPEFAAHIEAMMEAVKGEEKSVVIESILEEEEMETLAAQKL